ncbi:MAG: MmgE/PrpD family protein, partial [Candidatus Bathyarchaeia archaeon]
MNKVISECLSEYITTFSFADLPTNVVEKVKLLFLDFIGLCSASKKTLWSKAATEIANEQRSQGKSSIIGLEKQTSVLNAAFANGVMAHSLEFDDTHIQTTLHPGSAVIPAALSTAEEENLSGKDLIASIVLGYEVAIRVAKSVYPSHIERGFHITGTVGTFGAAVAASKNLGLKERQIVDAIGLAGTQAAGVFEFAADGAMSKRIHAGKAAMNGVLAALLAKKGVTGPQKIFEGDYGFCRAYSDSYVPELIIAELGEKFLIEDVFLKAYACCGHFQQPMINTIELAIENDIQHKDVRSVTVSIYKSASLPCFRKYDVRAPLEAQLS